MSNRINEPVIVGDTHEAWCELADEPAEGQYLGGFVTEVEEKDYGYDLLIRSQYTGRLWRLECLHDGEVGTAYLEEVKHGR